MRLCRTLPYLQQFYLLILERPTPEFLLSPQFSPFLENILHKKAL